MVRPQLFLTNTTIACDWRVWTQSPCVDSEAFKSMWWVMFSLTTTVSCEIAFLIVFKTLYGRFELLNGWSIRGNEGSTFVVFFSSTVLSVCAIVNIFDVETSQAARELLFGLPQFILFCANTIYIYAVIRLLPKRYWDFVDEKTHRLILPSRRNMAIVLVGSLVITFVFDIIIPCVLGAVRDQGNVDGDVALFTTLYEALMIIYLSNAATLAYVFSLFRRLTNKLVNESNLAIDDNMKRKERLAIGRINRVISVLIIGNVFVGLGNALLANVYQVFTILPFSEFVFFFTTMAVWIVACINFSAEFFPFLVHVVQKGGAFAQSERSDDTGSASNKVQDHIRKPEGTLTQIMSSKTEQLVPEIDNV